jgi:hypothetical protein
VPNRVARGPGLTFLRDGASRADGGAGGGHGRLPAVMAGWPEDSTCRNMRLHLAWFHVARLSG